MSESTVHARTLRLLSGCASLILSLVVVGCVGDGGDGDGSPAEPLELDALELGIYAVDVHRVNEEGCDAEGPGAPGALDYAVAALHDDGDGLEVVILPCADPTACAALAEETEAWGLTVDPVFMFDAALSDGTMTGPGRDGVTVPGDMGECGAFDEVPWLSGFGGEVLEGQSLTHRLDWSLMASTCVEDFEAGGAEGVEGECVRRVDWRATLVAVRE